jgi:hypothetical protein
VAAEGSVAVRGAARAVGDAEVAQSGAAERVVTQIVGNAQAALMALDGAGEVPQGAACETDVAVNGAQVCWRAEALLPLQLPLEVLERPLRVARGLQGAADVSVRPRLFLLVAKSLGDFYVLFMVFDGLAELLFLLVEYSQVT